MLLPHPLLPLPQRLRTPRRWWTWRARTTLLAAAWLAGPGQEALAQTSPAVGGSNSTAPPSPAAQPELPAAAEVALLPLPAVVPLTGALELGFRVVGPGAITHSDFPAIEGFRPDKISTTTATQLLPGGGRRTVRTVRQRYLPYAEGVFTVPAFELSVGGRRLRSAGGRVRVGSAGTAATTAAAAALANQPTAPGTGLGSADALLGPPRPAKFYEPPDAGRLALEADRPLVFAGQGVTVSLNFYLRPADQALLNFYDFNRQLTELQRQLRQPGAWEVPAEPRAEPDTVRPAGGGPVLLRFRLARRTYYPLAALPGRARPLTFPSPRLTLTKLWLLKNPQPGDTERLAHYKTYAAPALTVAVRPLPGPGAAVVGTLSLRETLANPRPRTGEAFGYALTVEGTGNPAALVAPTPRAVAGLEVFGPDIRDETLPDGRFRRRFAYRLLTRRPGPLPLDSLWQLPYFDPVAARYDTLRPRLRPVVSGAPTGAAAPPGAAPADDPFYGPALAAADTRLQPLDIYRQVSRYAAVLLGVLFVVAAVGAWRAGR